MEASWVNPQPSLENAEKELQASHEYKVKPRESADFVELVDMLQSLEPRDLRKAKAILREVFFNELES